MNTAAMNDDRSFWAEIKKNNRNAKPAKCKTVDGVSNDSGIAQLLR